MGGLPQNEARYAYDSLGRRIRKEVTRDGDTQKTDFLWQGLRLLQERNPELSSLYVYEPSSYAPLARIDNNPEHPDQEHKRYYFHTDQIGTPQEVTDADGHIVWRAWYKAWGSLEALSPNAIEQNLRFQGQYHDRETGLHYNTFRYYDPAVGRFTTQDPIGLLGGDNLYQYAPNPTKWIDPLGWCGTVSAPSGPASSRIDYSRGFERDLSNFRPGHQLISGRLKDDLVLVSYHADVPLGQNRTAKWWTTTDQANAMPTIEDIHQRLALPPEWGTREAVSVIRIPKGSEITAYKGLASEQLGQTGQLFGGNGVQYRFKDFDPDWIIETRNLGK